MTFSALLVLSLTLVAQVRDAGVAPPIGTATIAGRVVLDDEAATPVRKARVTLNGVGVRLGQTTTTDDNGAFVFSELPAGRFQLQAQKSGFLTANYGAKRPERSGTPVTIAAGQHATGLTLKMARGGVVTGTVLDQNGQPAAGVNVSVLRYGYSVSTGERTLGAGQPGGSVVSDDRGVFRTWGMPPGDYVVAVYPDPTFGRQGPSGTEDIRRITSADVQRAMQSSATARGTTTQAATPEPAPRVNYAPVYFPGTTDVAQAQTITLATSEERAGVTVQVQLVPTARVDGTVAAQAGESPRNLTVTLAPRTPTVMMLSGPSARNTRPDADGRFSFGGVAPGAYTITARTTVVLGGRAGGPGQAAAAAPGPSPTPTMWATTDVELNGRDIAVALELQPAMTINGRLVFSGTSPPPADLSGARFFLIPRGSGGDINAAGLEGGQVGVDGRFTFTGAVPGSYRYGQLWSNTAARGPWSLRSATANGRDVYDAPIDIAPGANVEWVLTFTDRPTEIAGALQDASGRAAPDYFIIVFPTDRTRWRPASRLVRMTRPGTDGQFSVTGLPPGEYHLAALTDVENNEWFDAAFLDQLVSSSATITLSDGQRVRQELRIGG